MCIYDPTPPKEKKSDYRIPNTSAVCARAGPVGG